MKVDMLFFTIKHCQKFTLTYAGPFEPRLIGVDGAALRMHNGKPSIFGPKIWLFFLTLEAFCALPLHARELVFTLLLHRVLP